MRIQLERNGLIISNSNCHSVAEQMKKINQPRNILVRKEYKEGDSDIRTQGKEDCQDMRHLTSVASVNKDCLVQKNEPIAFP